MNFSLPHFFQKNISLKTKTYYKMGGLALFFAEPKSFEEIRQSIEFAKNSSLPIAILGSGSNCVFSDELFEGVVISLENLRYWAWESENVLYAEAGVSNTEIAEICLAVNKDNAWWMYRMPGQIGASVRMNARCYGGEISQIITQVLTINSFGQLNCYKAEDLFIGYKSTVLMNSPEIVVGVRFFFPRTESSQVLFERMQTCESDRHSKQHFLYPSCGSTFKNNHDFGKPSGRIFDELGLKGTRIGQSEVSQYHGNFIWNTGTAKTSEFLELTAFMKKKAYDEAGAKLDLEVQPMGKFTQEQFDSCGMQDLGYSVFDQNFYYSGLFYHPRSSNLQQIFPVQIFSSFFVNYFFKSEKICENINVSILQLISLKEAQTNPTKNFLVWKTICRGNLSDIFPLKAVGKSGDFVNELWQYSVSEIFFAKTHEPRYCEFEMTPQGQWIALKFNDKRKRSVENLVPNKALWNGIKVQPINKKNTSEISEFSLIFTYENISDYLEQSSLKIQCALSLGNERYFLAPYWGANSNEKADFHQPERFWTLNFQ